jgi:non-ribosomal peptide synthetase component F
VTSIFHENIEIYNEYGPTEATVGCMIYRFNQINDRNRMSFPIGIPADNVQIYILDRELRPVPPGITGEIYISGIREISALIDACAWTDNPKINRRGKREEVLL